MGWTTPKTWNSGDMFTVVDLNTYVRDNSVYMYGDPTSILIQWASNVTPNATRVGNNNSYGWACRHGNWVDINGVINNASTTVAVAQGSQIGTIPNSSYWPLYIQAVTIEDMSGSPGRLDINTAGGVFLAAGTLPANGYIDFSGRYNLI